LTIEKEEGNGENRRREIRGPRKGEKTWGKEAIPRTSISSDLSENGDSGEKKKKEQEDSLPDRREGGEGGLR